MYKQTYSLPGKVFILGEYAILSGMSALIAAVPPRFAMSISDKPSESTFIPHPQSPLGRLDQWAKSQGFSPLSYQFIDPWSGQGGFGASTAQFAMAYMAYSQQNLDRSPDDIAWSEVWDLYRELLSDPSKPAWSQPSGGDLVSQWQGGVNLFDPNLRHATQLGSIWDGSNWILFSTTAQQGRKTATHSHLDQLGSQGLPEPLVLRLHEILSVGVRALKENHTQNLGRSLDDYAELLNSVGLEVSATTEDRKALRNLPGVLGVKGAGAMQSDAILVLVDGKDVAQRQAVIELAQSRHLKLLCDGLTYQTGGTMSEFLVKVRAPSNIALIKYMGKKDSGKNIPENPSISLTLNSLCTYAELTSQEGPSDSVRWVGEAPAHFTAEEKNASLDHPLQIPLVTDSSTARVTRHFERVRDALPSIFSRFGLEMDASRWEGRTPVLRTANTFPASSGIASSASSFAAITLAAAAAFSKNSEAFEKAYQNETTLRGALAHVSRQGSGSSCRSFQGPWVYWEEEDTLSIPAQRMPEVAHFVVLIKTEPKKVSSSSAHSLVRTSPLWDGRIDRVQQRTQLLLSALNEGDFTNIARVTWAESWEMHSLFHTCSEPFSYWEPGTMEGLQWFSGLMREPNPPIVTLDAGPNIHVIVEKKDRAEWKARLQEKFNGYRILEDTQGAGAQITGVKGF